MLNISLVSYCNTLPFKVALESSEFIVQNAVLKERNPAQCASDASENNADIALVPVGALDKMPDYHIISDYCIAAYKKVESVLLVSECPREEIEEIVLDYQSRTSVKLVKILAKHFWNATYSYLDARPGFENRINEKSAAVIIGDRALNLRNSFPYVYDLAEEWYKFSLMPAVFAVWVANINVDTDFIEKFNSILKNGVENRAAIACEKARMYPDFDLHNYLVNCIDYKMDNLKAQSMKKFLELASEI